jgi:hypothetical protein
LFSWRLKPLPDRSGIRFVGQPMNDDDRLAWHSLAISPDGRLAACILDDGSPQVENRLILCDARTGRILRRWNDSGKRSSAFEQLAFSPDGRLLASSDKDAVHVWEVATGKEIRCFRGHHSEIRSLAFSGNGRRLVSAGNDCTVLVWELGAATLSARGASEKGVAAWWADLAAADAAKAYAAIWRLAENPAASVPLLRRHLRPVTDAEMKVIRQHLQDLDSEAFGTRERAFQQLQRLGWAAEPMLRRALEEKPSLETRRRIERLLEALDNRPSTGELLRTVRALAVLEYAGTPEAHRLLRELAAGAPGGWLTQEAKPVCERLALLKAP